jgi:hypothetical protein
MPEGSAEFLMVLASGETVSAALRAAIKADELFDLPANLAGLFEACAFTRWSIEPHSTLSGAGRP